MESEKILIDLISIPSYVGKDCSEKNLGEYIFQLLSSLPWLSVRKELVEKGRFNVIAKDTESPKLLIVDHMDTVQPQSGWKTDPFKATKIEDRIYGLGATDTKGNIANIISAIKYTGPTEGVMYLFYIDEEYDFKGIKRFVKEYKGKINPKIIASGDGGNFEIGCAYRGLIEINVKVKGKSGHSAIPTSGKNAIRASFSAIDKMEKEAEKIRSKVLGKNTFNLAWMNGGQLLQNTNSLGKEGNVIPNYAEFVLEVRTINTKVDAKYIVKSLNNNLIKEGLSIEEIRIRHDLGSWLTDKSELDFLPIKN